jgi:hypothetical protein
MKKRTIKILGEDVTIMFCMAVICMYERANGVAFNPENIKDNYDNTALYAAAIAAMNPETEITFKRLMYEANGIEITELRNAIVESMEEWYQVNPAVMPQEPQPSFEESQGEQSEQEQQPIEPQEAAPEDQKN